MQLLSGIFSSLFWSLPEFCCIQLLIGSSGQHFNQTKVELLTGEWQRERQHFYLQTASEFQHSPNTFF